MTQNVPSGEDWRRFSQARCILTRPTFNFPPARLIRTNKRLGNRRTWCRPNGRAIVCCWGIDTCCVRHIHAWRCWVHVVTHTYAVAIGWNRRCGGDRCRVFTGKNWGRIVCFTAYSRGHVDVAQIDGLCFVHNLHSWIRHILWGTHYKATQMFISWAFKNTNRKRTDKN